MLGALAIYPEVPIWLKLMLVTGFLGGLTTFSTFSAETFGLLERGAYLHALGYSGVSLLGSLALRSEEHTSELQSTNAHLVCRLLLEKKKTTKQVEQSKER